MATIDERVVEMRFDNKDFEKNVQTSLKTIDKLKDSLDFDDATKSLDNLQDAAKHFSLDDIGNALEDLSEKFSWENVFKIDLLRRTLDLVEGEIKRAFSVINQSLMLDQVDWVNNMRLGWDKYAEKTQSVATIMAATGESMETVNQQMEKLMFFTDETSYNFTDMAGNIGKFTANGVSLEESVSAMEGIANWAARSGQEAAAASRVMYNLSQAIGMGALKLQDWKSVELANMGTKEFKEVAIAAGLASGTLTKVGNDVIVTATQMKKSLTSVTTANFRESLKEGWLDTETLIATLNEYGKASELISELNASTGMWTMDMWDIIEGFRQGSYSLEQFMYDLEQADVDIGSLDVPLTELYNKFQLLSSAEYEFSLEAYKAGQEARTFGQAMKSVSDAVSSGWMKTFELIFGQYEEAKELWSDLAENLFDIFRTGPDRRNALLAEASVDGWENLTNTLQNAGISLDDFEKALIRASDLSEASLIRLSENYESFSDVLRSGLLGTENSIEIVQKAIDSLEGSGTTIESANKAIGLSYEEIDAYGRDIRAGVYGWYSSEDQVRRLMEVNSNLTKEQAEMIVKYAEASHELHRSLTEEEYKEWLGLQDIVETQVEITELTDEQKEAYKKLAEQMYRQNARKSFLQGLINSGHIAVDVVNLVRDAIETVFPPTTADRLFDLASKFQAVTERIRGFFEDTVTDSNGKEVLKNADRIDTIRNAIALLLTPLRVVRDLVAGVAKLIVPLGKLALTILSPIFGLFGMLGNALAAYREATGELEPFANLISKISEALSTLIGFVTEVLSYVGNFVKNKFIEKMSGPLAKLLEIFGNFKKDKLKGIDDFIANIKSLSVSEYGDKIIDKLRKIWSKLRAFKNGDFFAPIWSFFTKLPSKLQNFKNQMDQLAEEKGIGKLQAGFIVFNQKVSQKLEELQAKIKAFSLKDFVKNMKENFKLTSIGQSLMNFRNQINKLADEKGLSRFEAACIIFKNKVISAFQELKDNIKQKLSNIGLEGLATSISTLKNKIIAKFGEVKAAIETFLTEHGIDFSVMFANFKTSIKTKLDELGLSFIWDYLVELKGKIASVIESIKQIIGDFLGGKEVDFKEIFGLKKEGSDEEAGVLAFFTSIKEKIVAKLEDIKTAIKEFFAGFGIDFSQMFASEGTAEEGSFGAFIKNLDFLKILKGGAIAAGIAGLVKLLFGLKEGKDAIEDISSGNALGGVIDALNPLGEQFERVKQAISGFNIITFAIGLLILAGALRTMADLPVEAVALALGTAGVALAEFIGTIAALNQIMGEKKIINFVGLGIGMLAIAGAMFIFAKAIDAFKNIDFASGSQALKTIVLLVLAVTALEGLAKVAGKFKFRLSSGLGFIAAAGAMYVFGKALESYTNLNINRENLLKVLGTLALAIVSFSIIARVSGNNNFKLSNGLGIIALALSLLIFAKVVEKLGTIETGALVQGIIALAFLELFVIGAVALMKEATKASGLRQAVNIIGSIVSITAAVAALALVVTLLGYVSSDALAQGVVVITILGAYLAGMVALLNYLTKMTGVKQAVAIVVLLIGITVALAALAAVVVAVGLLAIPALLGIVPTFLLMVGLAGVLLAISELGKTINLKEAFAVVGALILFVIALIGLVYVIKELAAVDAASAMDGLVVLGALLLGFLAVLAAAYLVGAAASAMGGIFLVGIGVVAVLFAGFILAIHQAITELERLSELNAPGIMASIDAIDALIDEFCGIAQKFNENGVTFETAVTTAAKMFAFGIGLHPLITDAQLLGLVDAEKVKPGIEAVDSLVDYMIGLRDKFISTDTSFGDALLVAGEILAFGVGLYPLANDVQILGLANATAAQEAIAPMEQLIGLMLTLAMTVGSDPTLFSAAINTSGVIASFGLALLPLVAAELISGFADAETVKTNMDTAIGLIDKFVEVAEKIRGEGSQDDSFYTACEGTLTVMEGFGKALQKLVVAEFIGSFVDAQNAAAAFDNVKSIIDFFLSTAEAFAVEGAPDESAFKNAEDLAKACKQFGVALAFLTSASFVQQFLNVEAANEGFQPIKDIIDFFIETAQKFNGQDGNIDFETAQGAAEACKEFGGALVKLSIAELISGKADAEAAKESLSVIKSMVGIMVSTARTFNNNEGLFDSAKDAADACGLFAKAIVKLAKGENKISKVDAEDALAGLEAVETTVNIFVSMAKAFARTEGMKQAATDAADTIGVFAIKLKVLAQSLSNSLAEDTWANVNAEKVNSVTSSIISFMTQMSGLTGLGDITSAITSVNEFFAGISGLKTKEGGLFGGEAFDSSAITTTISEISSSITSLTSSIAKLDTSNLETFVSTIVNFGNSDAVQIAIASFQTLGTDIITSISNGIEFGGGTLSSSLVNILKNGTAVISAWTSSYYNAGYNVIIGFNNGLVSGASTVYNNARAIASGVVNILRSAFKIKSPSRVFAEIGEYTMLGLAKGIEDTSMQPLDAVETLGDSLVTAMQNAMSYANNADYGITPTITPVMNMADMTSQSAALRSMVGSFDMKGAIASANIDGATINNSIQSKDIINEIRQLNERLAIMDENIQNLQVVLDTGALVGATSAKMDNQFGRMAMRRGRGN